MKIHRFIGNYDLSKTEITIDDKETVRQIRTVLKIEPGETIILSNGEGLEAEVIIEDISSKNVRGAIISKKITEVTKGNVSLYLAILKKENFELALQKVTECGVSRVIPIITERTVKTGLNIERLKKIAKEATEQSGRANVPEVLEITKFSDALELGKNSEKKIIYHTSNSETNKGGGLPSALKSTAIFIGPEGGFTDKEIALAKSLGYKVESLGQLILRGETAAIIATYRAVQRI